MSHGASGTPSPRASHSVPVVPDDQRQRVLIIDDEKDVHYSFRRLLEKEPLDILSAESGDEGVRMARKSHPDLIVMDIRMGQQSGLDTLKEIRQINPRQVVIMMTAYGTSQTAIEAMKLGAYDYVLKPPTPSAKRRRPSPPRPKIRARPSWAIRPPCSRSTS
jgi:DNA-binding NtrC family response regulator